MTSVNNLSDAAAKASSLVSNILSSLQASFGPNSAVEGLFANFLSQYQIPGLPPQASAPAQNSSAANNAQAPQNANAGNSNSGSSNVSSNARTQPGWVQIGGPVRQNRQTGSNTAKSQKTTGSDSSASSNANSSSQTADNQASTANVPSSSGNTSSSDNQNTGNAGDDSQTAAGTNVSTGNTASTNGTAVTDPSPAANAANTQNTNGTPPVQDSVSSELIALILQLERLAASQTAAAPAMAPTDTAANTGAAQGGSSDPGGKIDLKGLLTAIAGLDNNGNAGTDGQTGGAASAGDQSDPSAAFAASTNTQTSPPASGAAQAQQTTDKLASTDFLSMFSLANNQNNAAPPLPAFNPVAGAALAAGGNSDGASLDTNTQGQNGTGTRDASTTLSADSTTSPLAAGTTQASNPYDFASQLSALRAAKGGPTGLPTPVEQVVLQLSRGLGKDGSSQMTIQLKPAELGRVDVKLTIGSDGKVQGTVTADNSITLGLLQKDSRGLERALQEAGLRADAGSLQFSLRGDGQSGGNFGQAANNQSGSGGNAGGSFDSSTSLPAYADGSETYYVTPGGVNMRV